MTERIGDATRMECGICWHVYDPAEGDPVWQVPPGTPFHALPDEWTCPNCDAPRHKFMVLDGADAAAMDARVAALAAAYRAIAAGPMRDVPLCNPALEVEVIGFTPWADGWLGIVVTPWFMNAVLLPTDPAVWDELRDGTKTLHVLPSGEYEFIAGRLAGVGVIQSLSLFSPMDMFTEHAAARIAAEAAIVELLTPEEAEEPSPPPPATPSRRDLFLGRST